MAEIVGLTDDGKKVITNELFTWDPKKDTYNYSENSHYLNKITRTTSRTMDEIIEDIKMRKVVLDWMLKKQKRNFLQVTEIIRNYEMMPEEVYKLATRGEQDGF